MMKHEFEEIAGYEVSLEDYNNIIEPMYMATNLSKQEFVKVIDKKRFALKTRKQLQNEMKKIARHLVATFAHYTDYEAKEKLQKLAEEYAERFYGKGYSAYISEAMKWSCFYPTQFEIFNSETGHTVETMTF